MARQIMCQVCGPSVVRSDFGYVATCPAGHPWPRIGPRFTEVTDDRPAES